jgi:hypothetical protein
MIEAVIPLGLAPPARPLDDAETRQQLLQAGFDLSKPISWHDTLETNCRRFAQGYKTR